VSAPSGWYPDPGGQPDLYRFWDGTTWSAATGTNPASPSPGTPRPVRGPGPGGGTSHLPVERRTAVGWFVGAAALLVVIVVVAVIAIRSAGGDTAVDTPVPGPSSRATTCPDAVSPPASPPPRTGDRVSSGKLSYPRLGAPFTAPKWDVRVPFGRDVQNQDAIVEKSADGRTTWVAAVLIARLTAGDGFFGPEQGAEVVADCVVARFYGNAEVQREDRRNTAITVDGHRAWTIESQLRFRLPDIKTTGETMILVVVDTGAGEAGLFYASVPDTSPQFLAPARAALADLEVS